ncbi:hypothetical protein A1351_07570 [Methylosinus sp. R-45379]|uniref:DUF2059 domain-containing protein n=1 Tax=Methylosinus sp. LW3 TaxID=107635 RepID=UPI0004B54DBF|nr:DUF2059 domain-containing protein [Methylosinus sp. LW3]OAI30681.1 hypothetical protein A1351_07570 [Methylosinus sp. R-45379]TDX67228.1 hypothetical protein EDE12_101772 [Methylosinus sp. sav-2]
MIFRLTIGFAALILATAAIAAEQRPGAAPAAAVSPPIASAPTVAATPAQLALARAVLVESGVASSFRLIIPQYLEQIALSVTRTRPEMVPDLNLVLAAVRPEFDKKVEEMVDSAAQLYTQRFSPKELEDVAAFFKSASGRKYVGMQPVLMSDMFVAMQAWSQKISVDMMTRVREEMRKKGHEL